MALRVTGGWRPRPLGKRGGKKGQTRSLFAVDSVFCYVEDTSSEKPYLNDFRDLIKRVQVQQKIERQFFL